MRPTQLHEVLKREFTKRFPTPIFLWGPPGVGKSQLIRQVADEIDADMKAAHKGKKDVPSFELRDVRLDLLDPVDLKGFPVPNAEKTLMKWLPADFLPTSGHGALLLDEMNRAPHAVQGAAYQLVLDRCIGNYKLPDGWVVIAAGNRETDRSGAQRMHAALANRFKHLDYEVNVDDWAQWARKNDVHTDLLAFIRFRSGLLHQFNTEERAFPSPRSWMMLNNDIDSGLSADSELQLYTGTVGAGAAAEFLAFTRQIKDLPSIDEILLNPDKIKVPSEPATQYAVVTALGNKAEQSNFEQMMKFIKRLPTEFQVVFMRDAVTNDIGVTKTKTFTVWGADHAGVLV